MKYKARGPSSLLLDLPNLGQQLRTLTPCLLILGCLVILLHGYPLRSLVPAVRTEDAGQPRDGRASVDDHLLVPAEDAQLEQLDARRLVEEALQRRLHVHFRRRMRRRRARLH